jgi:predicted HTH domain antitoxin
MPLTITDSDLRTAQLEERELRLEIALLLYRQGRFTQAQARTFSGYGRLDFQREMADRKIPVDYTVNDLHEDAAALGLLDERR